MTLYPLFAVLNTAKLLDIDLGDIRFLPPRPPLCCPRVFLGSTSSQHLKPSKKCQEPQLEPCWLPPAACGWSVSAGGAGYKSNALLAR